MDDLDDELLQFAQGGGAGQGGRQNKRSRKPDDDDSDDSGEYQPSDSDEGAKRQPAKKRTVVSSTPKKSKRVHDSDEDDVLDGIDSELFEDDEDRRKLLHMNELEREMILAERAEKRDKERQRQQLLQQGRAAEKAEGRGKAARGAAKGRSTHAPEQEDEGPSAARGSRRKAGGPQAARSAAAWSDDDEEGEEADGQKTKGRKPAENWDEEEFQPSASGEEDEESEEPELSGLSGEGEDEGSPEVAGRAAHGDAAARARAAGSAAEAFDEGRPARGRDAGPYDDDEGVRGYGREQDDLYGRRGRGLDGPRVMDEEAQEEATLDELRSIQVMRTQLEEWSKQPFFKDDCLRGCVVRMAYGDAVDVNGQKQQGYMVMEIVEVKENQKKYKFAGREVNLWLYVADGLGIKRVMSMSVVSTKPITEEEYRRYVRHCQRAKAAPITPADATEAREKIKKAIDYRWTTGEIKEALERKRKAGAAPRNLAAERVELGQRLHVARDARKDEEVEELERQLDYVDKLLFDRAARETAAAKLGAKNKENRTQNLQVAYKQSAKAESDAAVGGMDVFRRRETRPNIYWNTKTKTDGDAAGAIAAVAAGPAALTRAMQRMDPRQLLQALALDVDMELLEAAKGGPPLEMRVLGRHWATALARPGGQLMPQPGGSVLSVADWKRRAGDF